MMHGAVLKELLDRLSAREGAAVKIEGSELDSWPADAVATLKAERLLVKAQPALNVACPGCGRHCFKPVEISPAEIGRPARIFIVCNEPEDFGPIDLEPRALEHWQITGELLADALSRILNLASLPKRDNTGRRWFLGPLRGVRRTADVTLAIDDAAVLLVAGRSISVSEVVTLDNNVLSTATGKLLELVDRPNESPVQRRERLRKRIQELRERGVKKFNQVVADEEGFSVSRLKQLCPSALPAPMTSPRRKKDKY